MSRSRATARASTLRLNDQTMRNLTNSKITTFATALYEARPFMLESDPRVAMAIVDARYIRRHFARVQFMRRGLEVIGYLGKE